MNPDTCTDPKHMSTLKPDQPTTPGSRSGSSDHHDTKDEDYVSCVQECLNLHPDCKRMIDDEPKILATHQRKMDYKGLPIFQQALNEDPELCREACAQITAAMYAMCEAIVQFNNQLGNFSYFASGYGKWKAEIDGGKRKRVRNISKMYFSHWELPVVSERRWRVNLEASISDENQTLEGDSSRPSE